MNTKKTTAFLLFSLLCLSQEATAQTHETSIHYMNNASSICVVEVLKGKIKGHLNTYELKTLDFIKRCPQRKSISSDISLKVGSNYLVLYNKSTNSSYVSWAMQIVSRKSLGMIGGDKDPTSDLLVLVPNDIEGSELSKYIFPNMGVKSYTIGVDIKPAKIRTQMHVRYFYTLKSVKRVILKIMSDELNRKNASS